MHCHVVRRPFVLIFGIKLVLSCQLNRKLEVIRIALQKLNSSIVVDKIKVQVILKAQVCVAASALQSVAKSNKVLSNKYPNKQAL